MSANIAKILSTDALDFSAKGYIALHRRIFEGVFKHAGQVREYNITNFLERFFRNLLLGDGWDLRNRYLHINATSEWKS